MKILLATALLSALAVALGAPSGPHGRIVNGEPAVEGEFPYFASVYHLGDHICGGFIYNQEYVVTAASCVAQYVNSPRELSIAVGQISLISVEEGEHIITVRQVIVHPSYDASTGQNDIALLHSQNPIPFSNKIYFIRYDEESFQLTDGVVMGFGAVASGAQAFTRLLKTTVQMRQDCSGLDPAFDVGTMMCAGSATSGVCSFDQGSPLVQDGVARGIVSRFSADCAGPAIYTRLAPYYGFFQTNAGGQPSPTTLPPPTSPQPETSPAQETGTPVPSLAY